MNKLTYIFGLKKSFILASLFFLYSCIAAEPCDDCWTPSFNFELEDRNFVETMTFISGHSYALSNSSQFLSKQSKANFFYKEGSVGSKELIEILNKKLSGSVTAEQISVTILIGLIEKYPCHSN